MNDTDIKSQSEDSKKLKLGMTEWLGIAQLIVLIIGGAWTAALFMKYDAHEKILAQKKAEVELRKMNTTALKFNQDITICPYGGNRKSTARHLSVGYRYAFSNTTNQSYKITSVVIHALTLPPLGNTTDDAIEVPPLEISGKSLWKEIATVACIDEKENPEDKSFKQNVGENVIPGINCGGIGEIEPGDSNWDTVNLIVRSRKSDYIGFKIQVSAKFEDGTSRTFYANQIARLTPGVHEDIPKSLSAGSKDDDKK